jgi:hypothetical protein
MTRKQSNPTPLLSPRLPVALAGLVLVLLVLPGRADAQFGFGGYGWGMFQYRAPSVEAINSNANIRASAAFSARAGQKLSDPGGRFAYRDQQIAMQDRYNFQSRQSFQTHLGRPANPRGTVIAEGTPPRPAPPASENPPGDAPLQTIASSNIPLITSFINQANQVVWPADSPTAGDLAQLRDLSDQATILVADQFKLSGAASLTSAAEARKRLLDYGRPALVTIRRESTSAIANTFHAFLLGLYDSIAQATTRPSDPPPPIN